MELTSHLLIGSAFDGYRSNEMKLAADSTRTWTPIPRTLGQRFSTDPSQVQAGSKTPR
jgi:hypothetical protein